MSLSKEFADLDFSYMRKVANGMAKHVRNMSAIEQLMSIAIVAGATFGHPNTKRNCSTTDARPFHRSRGARVGRSIETSGEK